MKSFDIIEHILQNPLYKNLRQNRECKNFLSLLGKNKIDLIKFAYLKHNTLFIALYHPLGLQELKKDSSISQIKNMLNLYCKHNENSNLKKAEEIKFFISKEQKQIEIQTNSIRKKVERGDGKFINLSKDKEIYELFEKIRDIINANR